jgi:hypothetical protein
MEKSGIPGLCGFPIILNESCQRRRTTKDGRSYTFLRPS